MNAYELAKELEYYEDDITSVCNAAIMLRQQADRIAELEALYWQEVYKTISRKTKPLSDEEINKLWTDAYDFNGRFCVYEFARAIEERHSIL